MVSAERTPHVLAISAAVAASVIGVNVPVRAQQAPPARRELTRDVPVTELGRGVCLTGKMHKPLGSVITVQGVAVDGPEKGYEGGPNLRVQRIDGRATQEDIQIVLQPYFNKWGDRAVDDGHALPELTTGTTYELEGYETGGFVGIPTDAYKRAGVVLQTCDHYFRCVFEAYRGKAIDPVRFSPEDFLDRQALIEGVARNADGRAVITGKGWTLVTDPGGPWPVGSEGKTVEGRGTIRAGEAKGTYRLEDGESRIVRLQDQVGREVKLRGRAWSLNGQWWFEYRGTNLYIEDIDKAPGFAPDLHGKPIEVNGLLEEAELPRVDQIGTKPNRDRSKQFVVRKASISTLESLLGPERVERPKD
jgi:hypothetical protein